MILRTVKVEDTEGNETWGYSIRELQKKKETGSSIIPEKAPDMDDAALVNVQRRLLLDIIGKGRTIKQTNSRS